MVKFCKGISEYMEAREEPEKFRKLPKIETKSNKSSEASPQKFSAGGKNSKKSNQKNKVQGSQAKRRRSSQLNVSFDEPLETAQDLNENIIYQPKSLIGGTLTEHQITGLNWMIDLHACEANGILADQMGLGKTIQALALLGYLKDIKKVKGPHIIIVPLSTLVNWKREADKWLKGFRVHILYAAAEKRDETLRKIVIPRKFDILITSYEGMSYSLNYLKRIKFKQLILDEAHRIKNHHASFSQDIRQLKPEWKLLMTGTPIQNNMYELWSLLNYILPEVFYNEFIFIDFFGDEEERRKNNAKKKEQSGKGKRGGRGVKGGLKNFLKKNNKGVKSIYDKYSKDELVEKMHEILKPLMKRRVKHDTNLNIPQKKEILVKCKLNKLQKKLYEDILINHRVEGRSKMTLRNVLMQLRKACLHPYLFPGVENEELGEFGEHLVKASSKLRLLDKLLEKLKREGRKVLLFSQFTTMLNILEDYCTLRSHSYVRLDGNTDIEIRDENIVRFQTQNPPVFLFLLSTRAGGLGINLTASDTVILFDSDWNPQMDLQAMDRAHRIGQKNPVNVYRLVMEDTIEERIIERQMVKLKWDYLIIEKGRGKGKAVEDMKDLEKDDYQDLILYGATKFVGVGTKKDGEEKEGGEEKRGVKTRRAALKSGVKAKFDEDGEAVFGMSGIKAKDASGFSGTPYNLEDYLDDDEDDIDEETLEELLERGELEHKEMEKVIEERIKEFEDKKL